MREDPCRISACDGHRLQRRRRHSTRPVTASWRLADTLSPTASPTVRRDHAIFRYNNAAEYVPGQSMITRRCCDRSAAFPGCTSETPVYTTAGDVLLPSVTPRRHNPVDDYLVTHPQ